LDIAAQPANRYARLGPYQAGRAGRDKDLCARVIFDLKKTPYSKIEALVSHFDSVLTRYNNDFNAKAANNPLWQLQDAQIMLGFVSTILAKAGIRE
jgi:hypothetical protein